MKYIIKLILMFFVFISSLHASEQIFMDSFEGDSSYKISNGWNFEPIGSAGINERSIGDGGRNGKKFAFFSSNCHLCSKIISRDFSIKANAKYTVKFLAGFSGRSANNHFTLSNNKGQTTSVTIKAGSLKEYTLVLEPQVGATTMTLVGYTGDYEGYFNFDYFRVNETEVKVNIKSKDCTDAPHDIIDFSKDFEFNKNNSVSGNGDVGTIATYANVANVNGIDVDLKVKVLSLVGLDTLALPSSNTETVPKGFKLQEIGSENSVGFFIDQKREDEQGTEYSAELEFFYVEHGTNTLVSFDFETQVFDIDNYANRTEYVRINENDYKFFQTDNPTHIVATKESVWSTFTNGYTEDSKNFNTNASVKFVHENKSKFTMKFTHIKNKILGKYGGKAGFNVVFGKPTNGLPTCQIIKPKLIADYHFDACMWDGTNNEVKDSSENNYHGVAHNAQPKSEMINNSVDLSNNGTSDYISLNHQVVDGIKNFTISTWVKTSNSNFQSVLSGANSSVDNELLFWLSGTSFHPHIKGKEKSLSISNIADNQWHMLTWTREADKNCIYVDNDAPQCTTGFSTDTLDIGNGGLILGQEQDSLGGSFDDGQDFEGQIDELMIWDNVRSTEEIKQTYNNQLALKNWDGTERPAVNCSYNKPIAEYRFDKCDFNGLTVEDSSGNNFDGTIAGDVVSSNEAMVVRAAQFKGGAFDATISSKLNKAAGAKTTVSFWMNWDGSEDSGGGENWGQIPISWGEGLDSYNLHIDVLRPDADTTLQIGFNTHNADNYGVEIEPYAHGWHHIVAVFNNGNVEGSKLYIDGVKKTLHSTPGRTPINSHAFVHNELRVGGVKNSDQPYAFKDYMDEVKIYNNELSSDKITEIYNYEKAGKHWDGTIREAIVCSSDIEPISEYRFDECFWNGTAGEVKDSSNNANHGQAKNSAITTSESIINRGGNFIQSNEQFVEIDGFDNVFGTSSTEFTMTAWIKPKTLSNAKTNHQTKNTFFAKASDPKNDNIEIGVNPNGTLHVYLDTKKKDKYADFGKVGDIRLNQWHFIAVSYKNGLVTVQIDNKNYTNSTTWTGATIIDSAVGSPLTLGASIHINNYFDGQIDEVKIFDKELTHEERNAVLNENGLDRDTLTCEEIYFLSGKVYQDENENGSFDGEDSGIANVAITLIKEGETEQESMVTNANGEYNFVNLSTGVYFVLVDSENENIPERYVLGSDANLTVNLIDDSTHNNFSFIKESSLPVGCVEDALMFQNRPTDISYLDLADGTMRVKKEDLSSDNINGAGYNKKDGYFWGYNHSRNNGTISRVGKDSENNLIVDHFKIPNLNIGSYTGDIDDNGHFYIKEAGNSQNVSVVDLDPESDTYMQKIRDFTLEGTLGIADWAFNPQDDKLYAVGGNKLYKIEPSNGDFISIQDINLTGSSNYGASFFDKNGFYYIYRNDTGEIFRIDVDAEHPQAIPFSTGDTVSLNDGAMCTNVEIRFDFGDAPYLTNLEDDGARHRIKTSVGETHYLGSDVSTENNGKPSIGADRDEYDDGVTINGNSLQGYFISSKAAFSEITIKTHGDGYLNAWIDWNRDGDFNASEQIASAVHSVNNGTITLSLNPEDIPAINFNGEPIYARFRYSSEENLASTGSAPDGEVEDYRMETEDYVDVRINDVKDTEGDSGSKTFTFTLSFDHPTKANSGLWVTFKDGVDAVLPIETAGHVDTHSTDEADFTGNAYYIQIPKNSVTYEVKAEVIGDRYVEKDEEFYVELYNPSNLTIADSRGVGTIINDDSPSLHIERINSDSVSDTSSIERKEFYTQIAGKDFDYSIVSYGTSEGYAINDVTVKIELLDQNTTHQENSLYGSTYLYLNSATASSRFNIDNKDDLKINKVTRKAQFKISYILDENGTLVHGNFSNQQAYNIKMEEGNQEKVHYSDNFSIRPAMYKVAILDSSEYNNTQYRSNKESEKITLAAGYEYTIISDAIAYDKNDSTLKEYNSENQNELNVSLLYKGKTSCADTNDSKLSEEGLFNYRFKHGQLQGAKFTHHNVGEFELHVEDINWTDIDKNSDYLGCIVGSHSNTPDASGKVGCNISSDEGNTFNDIKLTFQPYAFNLANLTLKNTNNNGKDYLYMNSLADSKEMSIVMRTNIIAIDKEGKQLSNFTKSCMAENIQLTMDVNSTFKGDNGSNQIITKSGHTVQRQQLININDNNGSIGNFNRKIQLQAEDFLDTNEGNLSIEILYNVEKLKNEPINPIRLGFKTLEANATTIKTLREGKVFNPTQVKGSEVINREKTFFYARVRSYIGNLSESTKRLRETPLIIELYCKVDTNRPWCDNEMNLNTIGRNGSLTDYGWYRAVNHDSMRDGNVTALQPTEEKLTIEPAIIPPFVKEENKNIKIRYQGDLPSQTETIRIDIITQPWLRYSRRNFAGVDEGTPYFTVKTKAKSAITGIGKTNKTIEISKDLEFNGKMDW